MTAAAQIEFYLPPPITPAQAAAIIGKLGGHASAQARNARERDRVRATARNICAEIGKPVPEALR